VVIEDFKGLGDAFAALNARIDGVADAAMAAKDAADMASAAVAAGLTTEDLDKLGKTLKAGGATAASIKTLKAEVTKAAAASRSATTAASGARTAAADASTAVSERAYEMSAELRALRVSVKNAEKAALRARGLPTKVFDAYVGLAPAPTGWAVAYYMGTGTIMLIVAGEAIGYFSGARWCRISSLFTEAPLL
jgi:hypothetical protein